MLAKRLTVTLTDIPAIDMELLLSEWLVGWLAGRLYVWQLRLQSDVSHNIHTKWWRDSTYKNKQTTTLHFIHPNQEANSAAAAGVGDGEEGSKGKSNAAKLLNTRINANSQPPLKLQFRYTLLNNLTIQKHLSIHASIHNKNKTNPKSP